MSRRLDLRVAALALSLFAFWLALSGIYTPFLVAAGIGASLAVAALAWRMGIADSEGHPLQLAPAVLRYWPWLAKEILKSGWHVARVILDPRLPVRPALVRIRPSQRTVPALVTHANSITLTPGTITVEATAEEFLVHALDETSAASLADGEMDRRVSGLEGRSVSREGR